MEGISRAEAMFELTCDWVSQRKAFGRRLADLQTMSGSKFQNLYHSIPRSSTNWQN